MSTSKASTPHGKPPSSGWLRALQQQVKRYQTMTTKVLGYHDNITQHCQQLLMILNWLDVVTGGAAAAGGGGDGLSSGDTAMVNRQHHHHTPSSIEQHGVVSMLMGTPAAGALPVESQQHPQQSAIPLVASLEQRLVVELAELLTSCGTLVAVLRETVKDDFVPLYNDAMELCNQLLHRDHPYYNPSAASAIAAGQQPAPLSPTSHDAIPKAYIASVSMPFETVFVQCQHLAACHASMYAAVEQAAVVLVHSHDGITHGPECPQQQQQPRQEQPAVDALLGTLPELLQRWALLSSTSSSSSLSPPPPPALLTFHPSAIVASMEQLHTLTRDHHTGGGSGGGSGGNA